MLEVLTVLHCLVVIGIAWVLRRRWRSTRDPGLLWLGVALVLWPLASGVLGFGERLLMDRLVAGKPVGIHPFGLVAQGRLTLVDLTAILSCLHHLAGGVLVLIGVAHLHTGRPAGGEGA